MAKKDSKPGFGKIQVKPEPPILPFSALWLGIALPFAVTTLIAIFVCALTGPNIIAMIPILMGISFAVGPSLRFFGENPIPRREGPGSMLEAIVNAPVEEEKRG